LREALIDMFKRNANTSSSAENGTSTSLNPRAILQNMFPNYIKVPEKGEPIAVNSLVSAGNSEARNISIKLSTDANEIQWWQVEDGGCNGNNSIIHPYPWYPQSSSCDYLMMVFFNDKIFPGALALISGFGILGLYTTFVFLLSRVIRGLFDNVSFYTIYTQMPCVDRVLQLCLDIYLVRESREFGLEEDLYAKLMFLYRSPETLIKWTRPIQENSRQRAENSE